MAVVMVGFSGCTKKTSTSSSTGVMKATAGGVAFSSTYCYESSTSAYYTITATNGNAAISLNVKSNNITTTTYNFDNTGTNNTAAYTTSAGAVKSAVSGSVTITTITPGVSFVGSFSFTCADGTTVTGGSFTAVM